MGKKNYIEKWQSRGQVLGHDGCYDSGTCPYDYMSKELVVAKKGIMGTVLVIISK